MPTGRLTFDGVYFFADGEPIGPVSMIEDATITEDDSLPDNTIAFDWFNGVETFTGELKISRRMRMMLLYGWRAKGPIRKRLLMRLRFGKPYRGPKAFDCTCRNHGTCKWCEENRKHRFRDKKPIETEEDE